MPKILLINPGHKDWASLMPLGLAYVGAALIKENHQVKALDMTIELNPLEELKRILMNFSPDYVGLTATTPQIKLGWKIANFIKKFDSSIIIVFGGVHVSLLPEETLKKNYVDYVVIGEGEDTLPELIKCIENKDDLSLVKGICFKEGSEIFINDSRPFIKDLDKLSFPARDLFKLDKYSSPGTRKSRSVDILTSRGCPFNCNFCCNKKIGGYVFRYRSPQNILEEIKYLYYKHNIEEFHIADDNFTLKTKRVKELCYLIRKNKLDILWTCSNGIRVDKVSYNLLKTMKDAGCYRVALGIESGDSKILKTMKKGINLDKVRESVEIINKIRITSIALFIIGNYGENQINLRNTIEFAKSIKTDYAQFTILTPFPGTKVFELLQEEGNILTYDWEKYGLYNNPVFETKYLSQERIKKNFKRAYQEYYFRPKYLLRMLFKLKLTDLKTLFKGLLEIIKRSFLSLV